MNSTGHDHDVFALMTMLSYAHDCDITKHSWHLASLCKHITIISTQYFTIHRTHFGEWKLSTNHLFN